MEKAPHTVQSEQLMEVSLSEASEALLNFGANCNQYVDSMYAQSVGEKDQIVESGTSELKTMVVRSEYARKRHISDFITEGEALIVNAGLTEPTSKSRAEELLRTKANAAYATEAATATSINDRSLVGQRSIDERRNVGNGVLDRQREAVHVFNNGQSLFQRGFNSIISSARQKTSDFENLCDSQKSELQKIVTFRYNDLKTLIDTKGLTQTTTLRTYLNQLSNLLKTLKAAEVNPNTGRSQNNANTSADPQANRNVTSLKPDPRIVILMGKQTGIEKRPYTIILNNIDHHRTAGKTDEEIYRLLSRHFHPDLSEHADSEAVIRVLTASYDSKTKRFIV